jgi:hypothetical protein
MKMTVFWNVALYSLVEIYRRFKGAYCLIILMMEAVSTSEILADLYQTTRRNIPEDSHLQNIPCFHNSLSVAASYLSLC